MRFICLIYLWLPFAACSVISRITSPIVTNVLGASNSGTNNISFILYTGETLNEFKKVLIGNAVSLLDDIDANRSTCLYISGWTESPESPSVKRIIGAYLKRKDHNVMVVDWQKIAGLSYPRAAASVDGVGKAIATALNNLVVAGLNSTTMHIVSHSLGCQVAAHVGRSVNFTLPRITGLDPAGPGFYVVIDDLTSSDAAFVDVIHTDAGFYGTLSSNVTVNFYPNGGNRFQPGCRQIVIPASAGDFCSHHRSWYYYAESLLSEDAFLAVECNSYVMFTSNYCAANQTIMMGYATPSTASGNYYLQTNSTTPYGKGRDGVTYVETSDHLTNTVKTIFSNLANTLKV